MAHRDELTAGQWVEHIPARRRGQIHEGMTSGDLHLVYEGTSEYVTLPPAEELRILDRGEHKPVVLHSE